MIDLAAVLHAASTTTTTLANATHKSGGSILDPIAKPLAWVLAGIYAVIPNYGVAIMGLSLIWMVIISPLTLKSTRSMLAMQKLQPELKKLQEKHKSDRQAFAQAQMDLFREHNVSPFGSCLPMLLPLPVFFALFRVIEGLSHSGTPKYLNPHTELYKAIVADHGHLYAFGMDLSKGALSPHAGIAAAAPYWIALLIMAGTSYMQSAMMMSRNQSAANANPQMRMMKYLAPLFAVFCIKFPAGVIVYYATSNICRILQQDAMYRFDPKVKALVVQEVEEVEEMTQHFDEREKNRPGYTPPRSAKQASSPAPGSPKPSGQTNGSSGRSRFRDLLAAAAEQQRAQQAAKAAGGGTTKGTNGGGSTGGGSTGGGSTGGGSTGGTAKGTNGTGGRSGGSGGGGGSSGASKGGGSQAARKPSGSKTNRKRRGR